MANSDLGDTRGGQAMLGVIVIFEVVISFEGRCG